MPGCGWARRSPAARRCDSCPPTRTAPPPRGSRCSLDSRRSAGRSSPFGRRGVLARELALGRDTPLRPRPFRDELVERLDLPEAVSGPQLERTLELLIDRLLARPERGGRSLRKLRLAARFVEQGTWRREVAMR